MPFIPFQILDPNISSKEFGLLIHDFIVSKKCTGCVVVKCNNCGKELCFYEGDPGYFYERYIKPLCKKCGSFDNTLGDGAGEEYEL